MGFNWAFKGLCVLFLGIRKHKYYCHNRSDFLTVKLPKTDFR